MQSQHTNPEHTVVSYFPAKKQLAGFPASGNRKLRDYILQANF